MSGERLLYGGPPRDDFERAMNDLKAKLDTCVACSDSRIMFGSDGPEPCPRCCPKLVEALREKLAKDHASGKRRHPLTLASMETEIDRLRAKCNRLLRKIRRIEAK